MKNLKVIFISALTTIIVLLGVLAYFYFQVKSEYEIVDKQKYSKIVKASDTGDIDSQITRKQKNNTQITENRHTIITNTVQEVSPSVVGINVTEIRKYRDPLSMDPFFRQFFGDRIYTRKIKSLGSGVIISPDGYIVTNDHVAGNASKIIVTMTDGSHYDAEIVGTDQSSDICLLKVDGTDLPHLEFGDSDDILIGEWIIALGNPFGLFEVNDKPTVTVGVISATGMNLGSAQERYYVNMMQTDAAINTGNSGGPLVNSIGELVGINTLIYTAGRSTGNVGVGFAIPINKVEKIVKDLKEDGEVNRDFWTGLSVQTVDEGIANYYDLKNTRGVIITSVADGSPADKAGLRPRDVILKIGGNMINNDETLIGFLQEYRTGDVVEFEILREGEKMKKQMKLESRE